MRYNYPNDPRFDSRYLEELKNIRVLHYLRCEIIHRERDFISLGNVASLITRQDSSGSNESSGNMSLNFYPIVVAEEERGERDSYRPARSV